MTSVIRAYGLVLVCIVATQAQDPGWPRKLSKDGATVIAYQPQVDQWNNFTDLDWRMALSLTPPAGKTAIGVLTAHGRTDVNPEDDLVVISDITVKNTYFPSLSQANADEMGLLVKALVPQTVSISMRRIVACMPKPKTAPVVQVRNDPPTIFVSNSPAILLFINGQPVFAPVEHTHLEFVVNTAWPLFLDKSKSEYYLLVGQRWMTANSIAGPWTPTKKLHKDMERLPKDAEWASLKSVIPPPSSPQGPVPKVFFTTVPSDVILFNGPPTFSNIPGTQLTYVTNTASEVFFYTPAQQYYYLTSGRWFRSASLQGPWTYATSTLPADFALIPPSSPASRVLASVPGTEEAKDAVLIAQIPTTLVVNPVTAAAQVKVTYTGPPQFKPIEGTSMAYATNTEDKVIKVGDVYYLCLQGIWFMSAFPQGPWTTATSVPKEIYTIPPSSPVYNVTYVTQTVTASGNVEASHTAGYLGAFVVGAAVGAVVATGSGYYYPPYIGYPAYGYPVYHPYATTYGAMPYYNSATGAYGLSQTAYGPYGSATRAAQYNPYTGTYARGASVSTPYGSRSAAQAYNPYTGTYARTAQGSSPGAQWGSSMVSRGGQSAYTQHYSTAQGTVGAAETSAGGRAAAGSTAYGNAFAGKTAGGDMYAGKDGNVYKNTGSGWQKYDNGNWNSVKPAGGESAASAQARERSSSGGFGGLNQEFQDRSRGARESGGFWQHRSSWGGQFSGGDRFGGFGGRRR
jgi:hypothetical protein